MSTSEQSTEPTVDAVETTKNSSQQNVIELTPSAMQITPKAFWYKVKTSTHDKHVTVIATSSSNAREGLLQQFGKDASVYYLGGSETIMQVNGELIV